MKEFSEEIYPEQRAFRKDFCFQVHLSLLTALFATFWILVTVRRNLKDSGYLSFTFRMTKSSSSAEISLCLG